MPLDHIFQPNLMLISTALSLKEEQKENLPLILYLQSINPPMATEYYRKSGQIPAFGDWEAANELPITQYFECARQAGLLRCSCSGECGASYANNAAYWGSGGGGSGGDLYGAGYDKPAALPRVVHAAPQRKTRGTNKGSHHSKEQQRKQVKVRDLMTDHQVPRKHHYSSKPTTNNTKAANMIVPQQQQQPAIAVKPVDEDLYKIPSELLENSKRKKVLGFFSRCMVPPCVA